MLNHEVTKLQNVKSGQILCAHKPYFFIPVTYIVMLLIIIKLAICLIAIATTRIGLVSPPSTPIRVVVVMATSVKNYQKGCAIQPAIHLIVGAQIDYE